MSDFLTHEIIGAAIEVHKDVGRGLLESIYEEALCCELKLRGIKHKRQVENRHCLQRYIDKRAENRFDG